MEKINRKIILVVVVCLLANIVGCADEKTKEKKRAQASKLVENY